MQIGDIHHEAANEKVDAVVQVMNRSAPVQIKTKDRKKLTKQDCVASDASGTIRIVLWERNVGVLQENESYQLWSKSTITKDCMSGLFIITVINNNNTCI